MMSGLPCFVSLGEVPMGDQQESTNSGAGQQPLYHRYTSAMTLKDIYLKMGGVCTLIKGFSRRPIYVISSCPRYEKSSNIKFYCERAIPYSRRFHEENIIDLIMTPVQDATGFVYKNVYCAQCNGVTSITAWSTKLDCNNFQSVELSDGRQQVRILEQFSDKHEGCQRQLAPEINRMLHECPLVEVTSTMNHRTHELRIGEGSQSELSPFPLSYSLLMNFGFDGKTHILFTTKPEQQTSYASYCNPDEMFDPHSMKCRAISCNEGYELINGACQKATYYESDSTPDDLVTLNELEEPLRLTLTIKNAAILDLTMLIILDMDGNLETVLQNIISSSFNISKERVQNVTITLFNTSDSTDQLSRQEIDVIILATTRLRNWSSTLPTAISNLLNESRVLDIDLTEADVYENLDAEIDFEGNGSYETPLDDEETFDGESVVNVTVATTLNPELNQFVYSNMSVNISFILYPAHKDRTHLEKSTKSVVQSMSDLVKSNLFVITINGTNFPIVGIYNVEDVQTMDTFCEFGHVSDYYSIGEEFVVLMKYIPNLGMNVTQVYVNKTGRVYSPGQYDLTYSVDGIMGRLNETTVSSFVFVCNMPEISDEQCSRIVLTPDEYELLRDESDMIPPSIKFANRTYNMSQFEWQNKREKTVRICAPKWNISVQFEQGEWTFVCGDDLVKLVIAESYLTFILGLISLVCLLSVLVTYGIFEKLRNLPGVNTMNLTLTLFLGEFVFMLSGWIQPHRWLCSVVGVVLHFLFLASFFWMNVMSYDVYCTFAKSNILGRIRSKNKYILRYSAYAWGSPLTIVAICCVIDFSNIVENVEIGYGGNFVASQTTNETGLALNKTDGEADHMYSIGCWIQEPVASMVAFGGPMIIILFSNAFMFVNTIICIRSNTKSTKESIRRSSVNNNVGHDDVMLYVKMSTVMGFTWGFGLASSIVSAFTGTPTRASCITLHLLGILFIVFNCSQGIFIFFVFVCNRRVLALYRGLYQRLKHKRKKPVSISSSCGTIHSTLSQTSLNRAN